MCMFRPLPMVSLLVSLSGCSSSNSAPTSPATPSPPVPQSYVVSGVLSEMVGGVSRPLARRQVHLYISGTCPGPPGCEVEQGRQPFYTDDNGRYTAEVPKRRVFVTANVGALQPCTANATVDKDTTIDVQVVPAGSSFTAPPEAGPTITGVVYETTAQGRTPLRGLDVWLEVGFEGWLVANTKTDESGRFFLCRVNAPVRMIVSSPREWEQSLSGTGDMFFEIELRR
jgi:hypothetical protein